jgi:hypothetical protein
LGVTIAEWPETSIWKGVTIAASFAAICAAALTWQAHKAKVTEQSFAERAKAYRARADQGDAKAESDLAYMYSQGQGVPQDYDEALRLRRKAADQGYADGEDGLGYMYIYGQGVPQDYAEALRWYRKAADQGDAKGQYGVALIYEYGQGVPQDYAEALRWCRKAADQGYAKAEYNLGNIYYYGLGVPQDHAEAVRWYQKAADQGDEYAQRVLHIKWKGMGTCKKISLIIGFMGSLLLLVGSLKPHGNLGDENRRRSALPGLLVLSWVVIDLIGFRFISILTPLPVVGAFHFVESLLGGTSVALLLSIVLPNNLWPKVAKMLLGLMGALLIGIELYRIAISRLKHLGIPLHFFWLINGMLLGTIASLAIVLWLTTKSRRDADQHLGDYSI